MTQIATTKEQARKLIELGIDVNTADMYYYNNDSIPQIISDIKSLKENINPKFYTLTWSLSALLNLIPYLSLNELCLDTKVWRCDIYYNDGDVRRFGEDADSPIDATYNTLCYLLENKLIQKL